MRCLWADVHVLKLFHSIHQCTSGPRHAECQTRDVAAAALVRAENLPKIWGRHHLFSVFVWLGSARTKGWIFPPEGLSPFSVALMLIQVITLIYTKLLIYSVVMLNKKIHWKCTNKNYNKGQLGSFFLWLIHTKNILKGELRLRHHSSWDEDNLGLVTVIASKWNSFAVSSTDLTDFHLHF